MTKIRIRHLLALLTSCLLLLVVSCKKDEKTDYLSSALVKSHEGVVKSICRKEARNQIRFTSVTCKYAIPYVSLQNYFTEDYDCIYFLYNIEYVIVDTNESKSEVKAHHYEIDRDTMVEYLMYEISVFRNYYEDIEEEVIIGEIGTLTPNLNEYL